MTLKEARSATGLSQEVFAEKIGVSVSSVRNWEQGRTSISSASAYTLLHIANICNLTDIKQLSDLVYDTDKVFLAKVGL